MRWFLLSAILTASAYCTYAQNNKFMQDTLLRKFDYLLHDTAIKGSTMRVDRWKGEKIGIQAEFDLYRLPVDNMICLVPNQNNPSRIEYVNINPGEGPGAIPNPMRKPRRLHFPQKGSK